MFRSSARSAVCGAVSRSGFTAPTTRTLATASPSSSPVNAGAGRNHKVVVIGGGTAGLAISHQLLRNGKFSQDDIAIVDPSRWHHYQPGWTLVGGGLKTKEELRRPLHQLVDPKLRLYNDGVNAFEPGERSVTLDSGGKVGYEQLVVAPGMKVDFGSIGGLEEAVADEGSGVSSIYGYDTVDKVFGTIERFRGGDAMFTQPAGGIKCAGAPQKIMWLALDYWKRAGLYNPTNSAAGSSSPIKISFATGAPTMFAVPKYSAVLEEMRKERGVAGLFCHDLVSIDRATKTATFASTKPDTAGETVTRNFDLLHVVPKMGPYPFVRDSVLANQAGYVDVDDGTTRHKKYPNVWSAGDASSLPTSKTAAAVTAEAPVLVHNLLSTMAGKEKSSSSSSSEPDAIYDGYTSCPLLTEYGKVMLAEFKYGAQPKETFGNWIDQAEPRREFYHLKKDFFPWVYYQSLVKGTWGGPKGWIN